ncbi:hypothetical protein [Culicoidibacter larvae]|uniref:Uncharacterized protein n=1 Tax=Culicoidibacter larvae TaxID=2579976 RepID=A0A5R8Q9P5_9FIRM|nr:hypothetical protein [Culicoidibacter larvae]TLG72133.1 hypothetical protein FEZ08_09900 [Culicoidibacter larvae]
MKKIIIILLIPLVILAGVIGINYTYNQIVSTDYSETDPTDQQMFQEIAEIYQTFKTSSDALWTSDYRLDQLPLVLIRTAKYNDFFCQYAYLINIPGAENIIGAKAMTLPEELDLPPVYRINNITLGFSSTWLPDNFGTLSMNNTEAFYYKYSPEMMTNPQTNLAFKEFMIHESFHVYRQAAWTYDQRPDNNSFTENYPYIGEQYALFGLEFSLLDQALASNDPKQIKNIMQDWLVVRNSRYQQWPQLIGETNTEAIEGTAQYTEIRYAYLTGGSDQAVAALNQANAPTFQAAFTAMAEGNQPEYLERSIYYETGSALGVIMDKLILDWKPQIEDSAVNPGKTQYEIIKSYYNLPETFEQAQALEKIKNDNNYQALLEKGNKLAELLAIE